MGAKESGVLESGVAQETHFRAWSGFSVAQLGQRTIATPDYFASGRTATSLKKTTSFLLWFCKPM